MDAEARQRGRKAFPQRFRTFEFGDVVRDGGSPPVGGGNFRGEFRIARIEVDEVEMGVAVHAAIVAAAPLGVNVRERAPFMLRRRHSARKNFFIFHFPLEK
jgi:hypothetical protein